MELVAVNEGYPLLSQQDDERCEGGRERAHFSGDVVTGKLIHESAGFARKEERRPAVLQRHVPLRRAQDKISGGVRTPQCPRVN